MKNLEPHRNIEHIDHFKNHFVTYGPMCLTHRTNKNPVGSSQNAVDNLRETPLSLRLCGKAILNGWHEKF